ncbi:MAG: transglycosylase domain-containing protein [Actinomycetota bacterium]|nr:transglycosylase domain-containing protein [Actinomycetota bacterium]
MLSPPTTDWRRDTGSTWQPRHIGRLTEQDWDPDGSGWLFKLAVGAVIAAIVFPIIVGLILFAAYQSLLSGDLPPEKPTVESEFSRVFDASGNQIALLREFDLSLPVQKEDIPDVLKQAVIAVEDQRFYRHDGVDDRAIVRALWADVTGGGYIEGASTITQQYVRLVYVGTEKTIRRKLTEAALARRVEKQLSKEEILYRYLSRVYLGSGTYGVGAAAHSYFHKSVRDLTLSEAALLAGLIRLPSVNEPRSNPSGAEAVRRQALDKMREQGRISESQYAEAVSQRVFLVDEAYTPEGPATVVHPQQQEQSTQPYYVDYVRRYLEAKYGQDRVYRGGLQVHTALDPALQSMAEKAVAEALKGTSPPLEMALVSVDPRTGFVRALVGGRDFTRSQVNLALGSCASVAPARDGAPICVDGGGTGRQPGSAFKPLTLAKALEKGIGADRVYRGPSSYTFPNCRGEGCTVHNVESSGYGSLTLRQATAYSVNTVYAQLIEDVGVKDTAELAHRLGLTMINPDGKLPSGEDYGPSLTLGAGEVSPLDMAAAFSVFANRGQQFPHTPVVRIETSRGEVVEDNRERRPRRVLPGHIADQMNDILKGVVTSGTGTGASIDRPDGTAGKTGTSEDYGDAWFVGYTPQLSTAIWMGYSDSRKPLTNIKGQARVYGGTFAAPTWKAYMTEVAKTMELTDFAKPGPVTPPSTASGNSGTTPSSPTSTTASQPTTPTTLSPAVVPLPPPRPPVTFGTTPPTMGYSWPTTPPSGSYTPPSGSYTPPSGSYTPPSPYGTPPTTALTRFNRTNP